MKKFFDANYTECDYNALEARGGAPLGSGSSSVRVRSIPSSISRFLYYI